MAENNSTNAPQHRQFDDVISIPDLWHLCVDHYRWFVVSLIVCLSIAIYYLETTPNLFTREAALLVKQESNGKNTTKNTSEEFNDIGMIQQTTNVNNVQRHLVSLNVIMEVVKRLKLADGFDEVHVAEAIQKRIKTSIDDEKSTIINLKYVDTSPRQAELVLNTLVQVYNEKWVKDKNQIAVSTSRFINERLKLIESDLNNVDDSISSYKSRHKITNIESVSDIYLQQQSKSDAEILKLNNQLAMAQYIRDILKSKSSRHQLLPTNSGLDNKVAEAQISQYNTLLLQLNNHLAYTSNQNPLILNQEEELSNLRTNIIQTIDNQIQTVNIQLQTIQGYSGTASDKISSNPKQAKHLISVERQQKVKESLYLYLLQKLEENEINMTYTSYNTQLIDIPHGSDDPTYPNSRNILVATFVLGLLIPLAILFIRETLDNTVRDKNDLDRKTAIPLIGEIPIYIFPNRQKKGYKKWKQDEAIDQMVVKSDRQDLVNEAFRLIRSNLEFMTNESQNKDNIYIITSSYPGSGKTFVSINLSVALAIKDKRVLLVDGDLRHASASHYFHCPEKGLSNFLSGKEDDIERLIISSQDYPSLSILPVGTIPPNPTELLSNDRLKDLFAILREEFDYIFVDCPPEENLADTTIIEKNADRTLFIIRAGLYERKHIVDLEADFQAGKLKHTSIILNCVKPGGRYGYRYGYGYKYGYRYEYRNK